MKKGIIYEVKLVDWIERIDIEADGNFIKEYIYKPDRSEWEKPKDIDEIKVNIRIYQDENKILLEKQHWETTMNDIEITLTLRKIFESLRRTEKSFTIVKNDYIKENDQELVTKLEDNFS